MSQRIQEILNDHFGGAILPKMRALTAYSIWRSMLSHRLLLTQPYCNGTLPSDELEGVISLSRSPGDLYDHHNLVRDDLVGLLAVRATVCDSG